MSILWTTPFALVGLALIALPVVVHLFVRQQIRTLPYPSLRFLRETQLAAFRRRRIEDAVLLACRCAIVAAAAAALAGPVVLTSSRASAQAERISRALVSVGMMPSEAMARLAAGAFASTTIQRSSIQDGVIDAVRWLDQQPRSSRELVVAGELRRGSVAAVDLAVIPPDVGIRFEQRASDLQSDRSVSILTRRNGVLTRIERPVRYTAESTRVVDGPVVPVSSPLVSIVSAPKDRELAVAALNAALDAGVPWRDFERPVAVVWDGADEAAISAGAAALRMDVPVPASAAADAVRAALVDGAAAEQIEPIALSREQLDSWSRQPGPPPPNAPVADEGDRKWIWALVLVLLGVESWLRRQAPAIRTAEGDGNVEARVA